MSHSPGLVQRHHTAQLLHELTRPTSAAVIAQLPLRPGSWVAADDLRRDAALSIKEFWTTVSRLVALGAMLRTANGLALNHDHLDRMVGALTADSPLREVPATHPRLGAFVQWGRVTRMPTEPALIDELYDALADLFATGETLLEPEVNGRIAPVHDDPAEVRRALVDRGLLLRRPGTAVYRRP